MKIGKPSRIQAVLVLDETGSMDEDGKKSEAISSVNNYVAGLKRDKINCRFTMTLFNSDKIEIRYDKAELDDFVPLTSETYQPSSMTPLYDAVGKTILRFGQEKDVIFVILTDGQENSSHEFTKDKIKEMITEREKTGWRFIFLGCGIDAMSAGGQIGIAAGQSVSFAAADLHDMHCFSGQLVGNYSKGVRDFGDLQADYDAMQSSKKNSTSKQENASA